MELPNRQALDVEATALLTQLSERHREELRRLLGNPPLWENVPETFWRKVRRDVNDQLSALLLLIFAESARYHGLDDDTAEAAGRQWAAGQAALVSRGYLETTQDRIRRSTADWLGRMLVEGEQIDQSEIDAQLESLLGPSRAEGLAVDAVTTAQTAGGEDAIRAMGGVSDDDLWITERDGRVCDICSPLHGQPRDSWEASHPSGPPAHPRCRCYVEYAVLVGVQS